MSIPTNVEQTQNDTPNLICDLEIVSLSLVQVCNKNQHLKGVGGTKGILYFHRLKHLYNLMFMYYPYKHDNELLYIYFSRRQA